MSYQRMKFTDPAAILGDYEWQIMHNEEEANERRRNIERTAVTAGVGFVRQQGEDSPVVLRYSGVILHQNQYDKFLAYYLACRTRTVKLLDFDGTTYDVIVTAFNPKRVRTIKNPRDSTINLHYWTYTIELEVL